MKQENSACNAGNAQSETVSLQRTNPFLHIVRLTRLTYAEAYNLQELAVEYLHSSNIRECFLLLLEHNHVITLGRNAKQSNLLADKTFLASKGVEIAESNRGGDITYHGPGQIVGYPILRLKDFGLDVKQYVTKLEEVMIRTCRDFGFDARRIAGLTGAWVGDEKIGSIGVHIKRWITMHGFAFNVNTCLDFFNYIVPCGIAGKRMTSLGKLSGMEVNLITACDRIAANFATIFGCEPHISGYDEFLAKIRECSKCSISTVHSDSRGFPA